MQRAADSVKSASRPPFVASRLLPSIVSGPLSRWVATGSEDIVTVPTYKGSELCHPDEHVMPLIPLPITPHAH